MKVLIRIIKLLIKNNLKIFFCYQFNVICTYTQDDSEIKYYYRTHHSSCVKIRILEMRAEQIYFFIISKLSTPCNRTEPSALPRALTDEHTYPPKSCFSRDLTVRFICREYSLNGYSDIVYLSLGSSFSPK